MGDDAPSATEAPPTTIVGDGRGAPPTSIVDGADSTADDTSRRVPSTTIVGAVQTTVTAASATTVSSGSTVDLSAVPPEVFERFPESQAELHSGAEAVVLIADHPEHGSVAVKVYRRALSPDPDLIRRLSGARSEHVVVLHEAERIGGAWVEVLERIDGGSLADLAAGGRLGTDSVLEVLQELATAVEHFHSLGLIHRDIKPANILVRTRHPLDLVLADFGLAAFASDEVDLRAQDRTIHYSSPETNSGVPPRPPADWWSLGMIVAELLLGRHPFDGLNDVEIVNHLAARDVDVSGIESPRWRNLCMGLLTRDAAHRWGASEVNSWLDDGDPPVWQPAHSRPPYEFAGERFHTSRELAAGLGERWDDARQRVAGTHTWSQLSTWLVESSPGDGQLAELLDEVSALSDPDARLFRLLRGTHPDLVPVYRDFALGGDGLARLASAAVRLGPESNDAAAVDSLFETRSLRWLDDVAADLDERWRAEWKKVVELLAGHRRLTSEETSIARARLLLAVVEPERGADLRSRAAELRRSAASGTTWFRALAARGAQSTTAALAAVLLEETAAAERRDAEAAARSAALAARREQLAETTRRYPRTRTMLGWTLVPMTVMAIAAVATGYVRIPPVSWHSAPTDSEGRALVVDAVMHSDVLRDNASELPWLESYVGFLFNPVVPVLLTVAGIALFVRGRGVRPDEDGGSRADSPVRSEWERRAMQGVIGLSTLYLPLLLPFVLGGLYRGGQAEGGGVARPNRARRILLLVASLGFFVHGLAVLVQRSPRLAEVVWQFPDWYWEVLAAVPPWMLATVQQHGTAPMGWSSMAAAGVAFVLACRTFGERDTPEVAGGVLLALVGLCALVPGVLLVGFYPLFAIAIVIGVILAVVIGLGLVAVAFAGMADS